MTLTNYTRETSLKCFSMPNQSEMQSLIDFCKVMATASFYQKLGSGGVMAIYLTAKEYNLPFMACLNGGLHTFDGKVTFSAIMIDALILNAGHTTEVLHLDEQSCKIRFTRGDRKHDKNYKPFEFDYTIQQAGKAGYLSKNNWKTSPKDMLYSRCITGGGRKHIPEVFVGVLVAGELTGTDIDAHVEPILPPNIALSDSNPVDQINVEPPVEQYLEGHEEFLKKHEICLDSASQEGKLKYISEIMKKSGKSLIYVVNSAIKNEKAFLEQFEKWDAKNRVTLEPTTPENETSF